jgi:hypothetical protein
MAQGDYLIQNQSFPSFRSDLNSTLEAINTSNSGTSRPTSAVAGTVWLDTTNATNPTLKFFDGTDDISLAQLDYTANTVNWLDSTVVADLINDTTPQLGGNLDVNGNSIVSVSNGNITFTPDGTGKVIIDGLSYPTADGTNGQALITDGSGNLSFGDVAGGTSWQSSIVTGTTLSAVAGNGYWIDTTSNACTVTLPASASVGDTIEFVDYARNWGTNAVTLNQNSLNFQGFASPNPEYNTSGQSVRIVYSGATQGWIPTVDDDVTLETPQSYSADFLVIAGGGSGGKGIGGGGGAGGYRTSTQTVTLGTAITVTVGDGGASASGTSNNIGTSGSDSSISGSGLTTITSTGGGGGGSNPSATGLTGGSGGGGAGSDPTAGTGGSGNTPSTAPSQGNNGGNGFAGGGANTSAGGGGGAGAVGSNGASNVGGNGGDGLASSITGSSVTRAGGGGGSRHTGTGTAKASGGTGGGGEGGYSVASVTAGDGTANTGSGGGGNGYYTPNAEPSGAGGKGVVIISVPTANYSGTTTGSPTVTTSGSNTIMQFNGSGSYTA